MNEKYIIPLAIVIAGMLIGGAVYLSSAKPLSPVQSSSSSLGDVTASSTDIQMRPISADDHILGSLNAKVIIVEYSDTECPYCKQFDQTLRQIMSVYGANGDVAWVYRHFPIDELHPKARNEAEATECVNELGGPDKFWQFLNMIYDNTPSDNGLDPAQLPIFAKNVGVDVDAFNTCLSSGKYADKVEADYQDAIKSGGGGTPHSILVTADGQKMALDGAYPYDQLKVIIDSLLK